MTCEELLEAVHTVLREAEPRYLKMIEDQETVRATYNKAHKLWLSYIPTLQDRVNRAVRAIFMYEMEPDYPDECNLIRQAMKNLKNRGTLCEEDDK